jgi:hypothetical protein
MAKKSEHNQVTIKLDPEDYANLCTLAVEGDRSNSAQARRMLRGALRNAVPEQAGLPEAPPEESPPS